MKKKHLIIIGVIILGAVTILGLYQTFALSGDITKNTSGYYNVTVSDGTTVNVPANSSKTVYYKLTNTTKGVVQYGVGYSGTNITVKYYSDTQDPATGTVDYGKSKFIKLYIENTGSTASTATLSTILGYEKGGDLIVSSGVSLVINSYSTYTISYDLNGFTAVLPASQTKISGKSITLNGISNDAFIGWSTNKDASIPAYLANASFNIDTDATLYAIEDSSGGPFDHCIVTIKTNYDGQETTISTAGVIEKFRFIFSLLEEPSAVSGYKYSSLTSNCDGSSPTTPEITTKEYNNVIERTIEIKRLNSTDCTFTINYTKA